MPWVTAIESAVFVVLGWAGGNAVARGSRWVWFAFVVVIAVLAIASPLVAVLALVGTGLGALAARIRRRSSP